jgi:coenzyme F420-0:L-glutamate ligase/coenzyme F420-1:gamma-L-glutamate ligase
MAITMLPVSGMPLVKPGDDLAALLIAALEGSVGAVADNDIVVVCQKIVSKAEGRVVALANVTPRAEALRFAELYDKDAAVVELALAEAIEVLRMENGHLITATGPGFICANSGLDRSNQNTDGDATLLPEDADRSARGLRAAIDRHFGCRSAVVVSDTFGRPWRMGQLDVAIGAAGIEVLDDQEGSVDWRGRRLQHTLIAVADQIAAAAGLLMIKDAGVPAVLIRGCRYAGGETGAAALVRPRKEDMFR